MLDVCTKIKAMQIKEQADEELHSLEIEFKTHYIIFEDEISRDNSEEYAKFAGLVEKRLFSMYKDSAKLFEQVKLHSSAGRCYFIAKMYQDSYHCYLECNGREMELGCCEQKLRKHK